MSKISQLNIESWNGNSPLIQIYRNHADQGVTPSDERLLLAATIHAVKAVAWGILIVPNTLLTLVSCGAVKNYAWNYALVNGEMARIANKAYTYFQGAMDELKVAEAQSYCRDPKAKPESIVQKLNGLSDFQIDQALNITISPKQAASFLKTLFPLREKPAVQTKIEHLQKQVYQTQKLLTGYCGEQITFISIEMRQALEAFTPSFKQVDAKRGAKALVLTEEQLEICQFLNGQKALAPATLKKLATSWPGGEQAIRKQAALYTGSYTAEEVADLEEVAKKLNIPSLQRLCLFHPSKSPQERAKGAFELLAKHDFTLVDQCLKALVEDKSGSWLAGKDAKCLSGAFFGIQNNRYFADMVVLALETKNLELVNLRHFYAFPAQDDEKVLKAWENCDETTQLAVAGSLHWYGAHCPKLTEALEAYAQKSGCEEILVNKVLRWHNRYFGPANQQLNKLVLEQLKVAQKHNFPKLRDACVDHILRNVAQFGTLWFDNEPDLIAEALQKTERPGSWVTEGEVLAQYANSHSSTDLGKACRDYVRRNWGYKMAIPRNEGKYWMYWTLEQIFN